ncbi:atp18 subunit J of the mitochondrial F1F0 ATP synthase [Thecaphora frezii]
MSLFGFRAYPTPIFKPVWPFMVSGAIVFYGINKLQGLLVATDEYKKDPRNPYAQSLLKEAH